jgi:hypothetical protein
MVAPVVAAAGAAVVNNNSRDRNQNDSPSFLDRILQFGLIAGVILIVALVVGVAIIGYYVLPTVLNVGEGAVDLVGDLLDPSGTPTAGEVVLSLVFPPYGLYAIGSRILG